MPDLIGDDEALRALDWERRLNVMEIRMRQAEARAEAWETRCLDAEAAAARLDALRKQNEQARELYVAMLTELNALRAALEQISQESGQVCPEFETCNHGPCQGSLAAKLIALQALGRTKVG